MGIPVAASLDPLSAVSSNQKKTAGPDANSWKINLFSKHLQFLEYEQMAEAAVQCGLDGLDLTVRPGGHVLPEHVKRDLPLAAKAIRNAGLGLTMMTTRISDPEDPLTEQILGTASELGVKFYRMGYYSYEKNQGISQNLDRIRRQMEGLARLNEKYRIHGAYQNHSGSRFGAPLWDLWQVLETLAPEWSGCQYDIRHAIVEGAESWELAFDLLKNHIRCLAIKDFHWHLQDGKWRIKNVPIGDGMVDFNAFFQKVYSYNIFGPISLHIEYPLFPDRNLAPAQKKDMAIRTISRDVKSLKQLLTV
jgi:sugar phosphate isomerase/epimerase